MCKIPYLKILFRISTTVLLFMVFLNLFNPAYATHNYGSINAFALDDVSDPPLPDWEIGEVTVDKDNIKEWFKFNGSAEFDDDRTVTLTEDKESQSGSITLKTKVLMSQYFRFELDINLGNKGTYRKDADWAMGADGMAFFFHSGAVDQIGPSGHGLGAKDLPNVAGFKIDTYYNGPEDPERFNIEGDSSAYGGFINTKFNPDYDSWDVFVYEDLENPDADAKKVEDPKDNMWKKIILEYDGNGTMKVWYDGSYWALNIKDTFDLNETEYSFCMTATTGSCRNLHQLRLGYFAFTPESGNVNTHHIDSESKAHLDKINTQAGLLGGEYTTKKKSFEGYKFSHTIGDTSGLFTKDDIDIFYVYEKLYTLETSKTVLGSSGNEEDIFRFKIEFFDEYGDPYTEPISYSIDKGPVKSIRNSKASFKLKHDQTVKFKYIPKGTNYKITETAKDGYTSLINAIGYVSSINSILDPDEIIPVNAPSDNIIKATAGGRKYDLTVNFYNIKCAEPEESESLLPPNTNDNLQIEENLNDYDYVEDSILEEIHLPKTGDNTNSKLWLIPGIVALLSLFMCCFYLIRLYKHRENIYK